MKRFGDGTKTFFSMALLALSAACGGEDREERAGPSVCNDALDCRASETCQNGFCQPAPGSSRPGSGTNTPNKPLPDGGQRPPPDGGGAGGGGSGGGGATPKPCPSACSTPPATRCGAGTQAVVYAEQGRCEPESGTCVYPSKSVTCGVACSQGVCLEELPLAQADYAGVSAASDGSLALVTFTGQLSRRVTSGTQLHSTPLHSGYSFPRAHDVVAMPDGVFGALTYGAPPGGSVTGSLIAAFGRTTLGVTDVVWTPAFANNQQPQALCGTGTSLVMAGSRALALRLDRPGNGQAFVPAYFDTLGYQGDYLDALCAGDTAVLVGTFNEVLFIDGPESLAVEGPGNSGTVLNRVGMSADGTLFVAGWEGQAVFVATLSTKSSAWQRLPALPGTGRVTDFLRGPGGGMYVLQDRLLLRWDGSAWKTVFTAPFALQAATSDGRAGYVVGHGASLYRLYLPAY